MAREYHNHGVVLIMVIFVVALLGAIVTGMLQMNTEDIQVMRNHVRAAEALAVAEAGLNDALAQLRARASWDTGFADKAFAGGTYTVTVDGPEVTSVGTSAHGFVARVEADVTVAPDGPPHIVEIDGIKVNE